MKIAGWDRFQGYKKRGPEWIKLHLSLIDQPEFLRLPVVARAVLPALWITAARTSEAGELPDDLPLLAVLSHVHESELREAIQPLAASGFIECDDAVANYATDLSGEREERESRAEQTESDCRVVAGVAVASRVVRPPMTPERQALKDARDALRAELARVVEVGGGDGQRELARASKTPGKNVIVNPESCSSLPWILTTTERLIARRLELEEQRAEDAQAKAPPPDPGRGPVCGPRRFS